MALSTVERDRIERWVGPVAAADEASFETWISTYGEPEAAALQSLLRSASEMDLEAASVGSGTDRSDHSANLKAAPAKIAGLVRFIRSNPNLGLTAAGLDLVAGAGGMGAHTAVVDTVARAPRRG